MSVKISILISLYKSDKFIRDFLDRLSKQTIIDSIEPIFILNECEGTLTEKFVEKFENLNKKIIKTKLEKLYKSWNRGLEISSGEYICNMNCDDYHYYNSLELMTEVLDSNLDYVLCTGTWEHTHREVSDFDEKNIRNMDISYGEKNDRYCGPFPMWRKSVHEKIGVFSEKYVAAGDHEMWLRMLKNGYKFLLLNNSTCIYNNRSDTLSNRESNNSNNEINDILGGYKGYEHFF